MASKIEHCPFCQSHRLHVNHHLLSYAVTCETCKAKGAHHKTIEAALQDWNRVAKHAHHAQAVGEPMVEGHLDNLQHAVRNLSLVLRRYRDDTEEMEH